MASTKKPGFIFEAKPVTEKKRRKSDLVVMWITLWDVMLYIASEIWLTFQGVLEVGKIFFKADEVWQIREWLKEHLRQVPDDFTQSWRDGIILCKLLNKLQPGCYPDAYRLNTNFGVRNLSKAFGILESRFDIVPKVTVEEIVTCSKDSESKLIDLLLQLKQKTDDNENVNEFQPAAEENVNAQDNGITETKNCIAKGTGLMVGFVGRATSFGVFFSSISDLNLVLEIRGPSNTICSERITKRSPKRKNVINPWKPLSPHALIRSSSNEENATIASQDLGTETEKRIIPLEYEINSNQISFTYFPLIQGEHRIAVLSNGQHVSDSPYILTIEPSVKDLKIESMAHIKSVLKPPRHSHTSEEDESNRSCVRFQEPSERKERLGKVLKRQVLRCIVKIKGKDVVVDTDNINNLATSLLKMDYELQKRPLVRRNSWGFVGDAERKISAIRQFGIDLDELEAQSMKMQRSHSLSLSPLIKKPQKIRSSYECEDIFQQTVLETVTEGRVSCFSNSIKSHTEEEEEDVFALMDENFDRLSDVEIERELVDEREVFDATFLKNSEDKIAEQTFSDNDVEELYKAPLTTLVQMPLESEHPDTQYLTPSIGELENYLTSVSECSTCRNMKINEEKVTQKPETKTEMISSDANKNSEITEFSFNHVDHVAIGKRDKERNRVEAEEITAYLENNIEEFKDLEDLNDVFIVEKPCTKTDAKIASSYGCERNMLHLLDATKEDISNNETLEKLTGKEIQHSNCDDNILQTKQTENSVISCQCKYARKTPTCERNLHCFVKNKHSINGQLKFKNCNVPKTRNKSFGSSEINKSNHRGKRMYKHQQLNKNTRSNRASYYTKERKSSSKSPLEDSLLNKLQCIIQSMEHVDVSSLCKMASTKSIKSRSASDPTYKPFNKKEENKDLKCNLNENARKPKYQNNKENHKWNSNSSFKSAIDTDSHLPNTFSEHNLKQNEDGTECEFMGSKGTTEFGDLHQYNNQNNNIFHHQTNNKFPKKHSREYEPFVVCATNSTSNNSCESFAKSDYEISSNGSQMEESTPESLCRFTYKHFNPTLQFDMESPINNYSRVYEPFATSATNSTSNNSCEIFVKSDCEISSIGSQIEDSTSKSTAQFTYKHFNPTLKFDVESPVKKQIKLWENSTIQKNDKPVSKYKDKLHVLPESVDIKAKLKFWENAYHHSENEELKNVITSRNSENSCEREKRSDTSKSISSGVNLQRNAGKQIQIPPDGGSKETNINNSNYLDKTIDSKMLDMDSTQAKTRSFSDPGVLDNPDNELEDDYSLLGYRNEKFYLTSSKDEMSSSNDNNFIELFADDEESSMELLCSTEDEYIDDEISENISTYWGDLSLVKDFRVYDSSEYDEFLQLMNSESLQSCADQCKFFGIATYFGHVAVKNRFWVLTKGAGRGNLSASVQGIGQHNVAFVSVEYTRKDIYEVTYQVLTPGLYLVSVRWMDSPIPGSPFLCKVTF